MSGLQEVLSEIKRRRVLCRENNVAPGTANEDAIYRICEEIVSNALAERTRALSQLEAGKVGPHSEMARAGAVVLMKAEEDSRGAGTDTYRDVAVKVWSAMSTLASPSLAPEAEPVAWRYEDCSRSQGWDTTYSAFEPSPSPFIAEVTPLYEATPTHAVDADAVIEADDGWTKVPEEPPLELLKSINIDNQVLAYEKGRYYNAWFTFEPGEGAWFWTDDADSEPDPSHYRALSLPPSADKGE
ncbi:hypothetical protein GGQ64_005367 [Rhizobium azooxidifex]|uniref:DUF551 domain-containing protein n=1 Tax=Mycoplana azooxidifex TaxID=1636188 RepID=A0A7W6GLV2_9HYPH|nr:hypothetical protein [Mycoplana azooxidifex]MBB3980120.1 hypothetical protein [Mycoplana azooxidifex]